MYSGRCAWPRMLAVVKPASAAAAADAARASTARAAASKAAAAAAAKTVPVKTPLPIAFRSLCWIPVVRRSIRRVRESSGMGEQVKHCDAVLAIRSEIGDLVRYGIVKLDFPLRYSNPSK